MKLIKGTKKKTIKALNHINTLIEIDFQMYKDLSPQQFGENGGWWFLDYYNTLDIVYLLMVGQKHRAVYDHFQSPPNIGQKPQRPVAWYRTEFNFTGERYLTDGPEGYRGYICDRIDDLIHHNRNLDGKQKYDLLYRMFSDLIKIDKKFKKRKK